MAEVVREDPGSPGDAVGVHIQRRWWSVGKDGENVIGKLEEKLF